MPRISKVLHDREMYWVEKHQPVSEVARKMADLNVGAILVLENGQLRGIFSERDLMRRIVLDGLDPARTSVGTVMSTGLTTIDHSARIDEAKALMHDCNCRHLPVMRDQQVVGMISMRDVMNHELEEKTEELRHMRAYIGGQA